MPRQRTKNKASLCLTAGFLAKNARGALRAPTAAASLNASLRSAGVFCRLSPVLFKVVLRVFSPTPSSSLRGQFKGQVAMSFSLVQFPPHAVLAHLVVVPGQVASLVSLAGVPLRPAAFRLVFQVAGSGGWLVLASRVAAASVAVQPSLF